MKFKDEYLNNGYMYSGSMGYSHIRNLGFSKEAIAELINCGLIEKRNCGAYAYQLINNVRKKLIQENNLETFLNIAF